MSISLAPRDSSTPLVGGKGHKDFAIAKISSAVRQITVQYDNDKIISLQLQYWDGENSKVVGNPDDKHTKFYFNFEFGETLKSFTYRDSAYGHGSLRSFDLTTSSGRTFSAGPGGYDNQESPEVTGCSLLGFYGTTNKDGFISSFGLTISSKVRYVTVTKLLYDLQRKSVGEPQNISVDTVVNDQTGLEPGMAGNQVVRHQKYARSKTNNWSSAFTDSLGQSISISAGAEGVGMSYSMTNTTTDTQTTGGEIKETWEDEYTVTVNGMPGKRCECTIFKTTNKVFIPFTCSTTIKYLDGTELKKDGSGVFEGTEDVYTAKFTNGNGSFTPVRSKVMEKDVTLV